jgi:hypothetical protein
MGRILITIHCTRASACFATSGVELNSQEFFEMLELSI